jgi:hypothetical protein
MSYLRESDVTRSFVMTGVEQRLLGTLKRARRKAVDPFDNIAPHMVADDTVLIRIAKARPASRAELLKLDGVTQLMVKRYGDLFLKAVKEFGDSESGSKEHVDPLMPSAVDTRAAAIPWKQALQASSEVRSENAFLSSPCSPPASPPVPTPTADSVELGRLPKRQLPSFEDRPPKRQVPNHVLQKVGLCILHWLVSGLMYVL